MLIFLDNMALDNDGADGKDDELPLSPAESWEAAIVDSDDEKDEQSCETTPEQSRRDFAGARRMGRRH
ncbi:hypothetical protein B0I35DRAFT_160883 [Stachybotrys elegans]|uniref:Uncharacterized protein n=1 Tax=Stachybotrys elegans TaxID=80388 RepID=A0A8K0WTQ0_9HYPO|nr:hypothetical protein B0I35DRAFT_160883 [Stachybotrys elegans]